MVVEPKARTITVMDPRAEAIPEAAAMAPRPDSLHGKVLGLLHNSKANADVLVRMVGDLLKERFEIQDVKFSSKPDASRPAPVEVMEDLAGSCDFAVVAVGD
ncbi:MAG: hypothetical protein ACE5JL_19140 [Dehalococcoidia bacterium]